MADSNTINFGYFSSRSLTFTVFQPDGTPRGAANQILREIGSNTGYYSATPSTPMVAQDVVIIKEAGQPIAYGQYMPVVSMYRNQTVRLIP